MNKMNARVTKVGDGEVIHSGVGNRACRWPLDRAGPGVAVGGHQATGKREIKHDRAESLVPATEQGSPRFLGEHVAAGRGCWMQRTGDSACGAKTGWRVRNPVSNANRG